MAADSVHPYIDRLGPPVVRAGVVQPISPAVSIAPEGRLVFVSGQVPMVDGVAAAGGISGQTHAVVDMIEVILKRAGCTLDDVVKVTVWLIDAGDYPVFNAAYAERFGTANAPARSTVISGLIAPVLIEMEAVAVCRAPGDGLCLECKHRYRDVR